MGREADAGDATPDIWHVWNFPDAPQARISWCQGLPTFSRAFSSHVAPLLPGCDQCLTLQSIWPGSCAPASTTACCPWGRRLGRSTPSAEFNQPSDPI